MNCGEPWLPHFWACSSRLSWRRSDHDGGDHRNRGAFEVLEAVPSRITGNCFRVRHADVSASLSDAARGTRARGWLMFVPVARVLATSSLRGFAEKFDVSNAAPVVDDKLEPDYN